MKPYRYAVTLALTSQIALMPLAHSADTCEDLFKARSLVAAVEADKTLLIDRIEQSLTPSLPEAILNGLHKKMRALNVLVKKIADPKEGILVKRLMVQRAKYTVDSVYYIFERDMTSYTLLNEYKEALKRGVSLRLAIDSAGSMNMQHNELKALIEYARDNAGFKHDPKDYSKILSEKATIEIYMLNPVNPASVAYQVVVNFFRRLHNEWSDKQVELYKDWQNRRFHNKTTIIDRDHSELISAIYGGRNIGDDYYGVDDDTFHDNEDLIMNDPNLPAWRSAERNSIGPVLNSYFESIIGHLGNRRLDIGRIGNLIGFKSQIDLMEKHAAALDSRQDFAQKLQEMTDPNHDFMDPASFDTSKWRLLHTLQNVLRRNLMKNPDLVKNEANYELENFSDIMTHVRHRVRKAKKSIQIVSPYVYFEPEEVEYLKKMLRENPDLKIEVVTNSIMTSDNMMAQAYVDELIGPEFAGTERFTFYEYGRLDADKLGGQGHYGKLHQKSIVIDGEWAFEGTFNFDERSRYLNSENMGWTRSLAHGAKAVTQFETLKSQSTRFGSEENIAIRMSPKLGKAKHFISEHQMGLYKLLEGLGMTWLI